MVYTKYQPREYFTIHIFVCLLFIFMGSVSFQYSRPAPFSDEPEAIERNRKTDYSLRVSLDVVKSGRGLYKYFGRFPTIEN